MNKIAQIELSIEQRKQSIARHDALLRLQDNPDFQVLVAQGYFKDEACRLVLTKNDPANLNTEGQESVLRDIDAISSFHAYLAGIARSGNVARKCLEGDMETLEHYENGGE